MRTVMLLILAMAVLATAPAAAPAQTSCEVDVIITVLPYAVVSFEEDEVEVKLPRTGSGKDRVYVAGTVVSNCPVMLFADIEPPEGAAGDWYVIVRNPVVPVRGVNFFKKMLRIDVVNFPPDEEDDAEFALQLIGSSLGESPTAQPGQVVVTVMTY